jgi:YggT family protein
MTSLAPSEAKPIQTIINFANILVIILEVAIFLRAMLSWFPSLDQGNLLFRILNDITEPILAPLRQVVPKFGMIDITPMVAFLVLFVIQQALAQLA